VILSRTPEELWLTAVHEAAHAVVNYRLSGFAGGGISIVEDPVNQSWGHAIDATSDSLSPEHMEARIMSCYAGEYGQCLVKSTVGDDGCRVDQEIAGQLLVRFGWTHRQTEFRNRSRECVESHWAEIKAVATELLATEELDDAEVEIIADIAAGELSTGDLEKYRALKASAVHGER
jgi:hypothetical protein